MRGRAEEREDDAYYFKAMVVPHLVVERDDLPPELRQVPSQPWEIGARWDCMRLIGHCFNVPYAGWSIWPEAERVRRVEVLAREGAFAEALELIRNGSQSPDRAML